MRKINYSFSPYYCKPQINFPRERHHSPLPFSIAFQIRRCICVFAEIGIAAVTTILFVAPLHSFMMIQFHRFVRSILISLGFTLLAQSFLFSLRPGKSMFLKMVYKQERVGTASLDWESLG